VPAGIFIMDKNFNINFSNEHFKEFFGSYSAREFFALVFAKEAELEGWPEDGDLPYSLAKNGSGSIWLDEKCFSVNIKLLGGKKSSQDVFMTFIVDITDLMREKDQAQAATKSKSDFLSRMSHEIRTPMNVIIGMTRIAQLTEEAEKLRHCLSAIESSSRLLLGIINDVLDMSKIEAGKLDLEYAPLKLEKILSFLQDMIAGDLAKKHISFSLALAPGIHLAYLGDETRLTQVLSNILSNALKFTRDHGRITLEIQEMMRDGDQSRLRFTVTDTGIGLTGEQMSRLFTSFEQADGSITRRFGGTGLGLAISKSIVEKMGGRIWAESEFGMGSTFIFEINLVRRAENTKAELLPPDLGAPDFSGKTILLVEDIEINREIFIGLLDGTQVVVEAVDNGLEAVMRFKAAPQRYDLIVMDVQMPVMNGFEATAKIRALPGAKDVPIIAFTAAVFTDEISECLKVGMNDHLSKPIDYEQLIEKMRKYLG
jgi:CheY-like chemotaxis protein/nitrogen-specific signal transduction histidine kinase